MGYRPPPVEASGVEYDRQSSEEQSDLSPLSLPHQQGPQTVSGVNQLHNTSTVKTYHPCMSVCIDTLRSSL